MILKKFKIFKIILILFAVTVLLILIFSRGQVYNKNELTYGATFSKKQALSLGLDWQKLYLEALDDLNIKHFRIPAYWDEIEATKGEYNYTDLDWQIVEAEKRGAQVILAIGGRLPRWPECHMPDWTNNLEKENREKATFKYLKKTVERYKNNKSIYAWQIENEYFLAGFGECQNFGTDFLDAEITLVKKLDPEKPIVITDSGELSLWVPAAKRADIFGTSLYLNTYSGFLKKYIHYPITPGFFHFKKNIASLFANPKKWIVIELQAEPWGPIPYQNMSDKERSRTMDLEKFRNIIEFSRKAGFKEFYLWGLEWWSWEKEKNNNPLLWEEAKKIFN